MKNGRVVYTTFLNGYGSMPITTYTCPRPLTIRSTYRKLNSCISYSNWTSSEYHRNVTSFYEFVTTRRNVSKLILTVNYAVFSEEALSRRFLGSSDLATVSQLLWYLKVPQRYSLFFVRLHKCWSFSDARHANIGWWSLISPLLKDYVIYNLHHDWYSEWSYRWISIDKHHFPFPFLCWVRRNCRPPIIVLHQISSSSVQYLSGCHSWSEGLLLHWCID